MSSAIDPEKPADGVPAAKSELRANLAAAKSELEHGGFADFTPANYALANTQVLAHLQGIDKALGNVTGGGLPGGWRDVRLNHGAAGDGASDDTAAIQAAFDAGEGVVIFPPGTYLISSTIHITHRVKVYAVGAFIRTHSSWAHGVSDLGEQSMFWIDCGDGFYWEGGKVEGKPSGGATNANYGFFFDSFEDRNTIRNVNILNFSRSGVYAEEAAWNTVLEHVTVSTCDIGFDFDDADGSKSHTMLHLINCYAKSCRIGYHFIHVSGLSMMSCASDNIYEWVIDMEESGGGMICGGSYETSRRLLRIGSTEELTLMGVNGFKWGDHDSTSVPKEIIQVNGGRLLIQNMNINFSSASHNGFLDVNSGGSVIFMENDQDLLDSKTNSVTGGSVVVEHRQGNIRKTTDGTTFTSVTWS